MSDVVEQQVPEGYKQTDVGVIPEDWNVAVLSEVSNKITDGTHDTPKPVSVGVPFLTAIHVKENNIGFNSCYYLPQSVHDEIYRRCNPERNDVLMVNIGAGVATTALVNVDYEFSLKNVALIKPKKSKLLGPYLNFYQSYVKNKIFESLSSGGAQPFLSLAQIGQLNVSLPKDVTEQTAIANTLSDVDALIISLEKLITKKRAIKTAAMQQLLTGKKRLPPFDKTHIGYKQTELGGIPEDWMIGLLPKYIWYQEGPGLRNWQFTTKGIKVINVTNLQYSGYLNLDKTDRHISLDEFEKIYKHFECDSGDFVMASSGNSYCKASVVRECDLPLLMNTSVIRFKALDVMDSGYMQTYLKSRYFKEQIDLLITGGAQPNFGPFHLNKILLPIPSTKEEQNSIASVLIGMDKEIESLEKRLNKTQQLKQGMMQELLTGRTRLI